MKVLNAKCLFLFNINKLMFQEQKDYFKSSDEEISDKEKEGEHASEEEIEDCETLSAAIALEVY